jgi:zinc protease
MGFFGPDAENVTETRAMSMAANILSSRMVKTIREEKNLVYSIVAQSAPNRTLPGFGMFAAGAPAEPENATPLASTINEMFDEFAKNGPTDEEIAVAKKQVANQLDETMKQAGFWTSATANLDYHGSKLDDVVGAPAAYQALTADQVHKVFAKYCKDDAKSTFIVRPSGNSKGNSKGHDEDEGG